MGPFELRCLLRGFPFENKKPEREGLKKENSLYSPSSLFLLFFLFCFTYQVLYLYFKLALASLNTCCLVAWVHVLSFISFSCFFSFCSEFWVLLLIRFLKGNYVLCRPNDAYAGDTLLQFKSSYQWMEVPDYWLGFYMIQHCCFWRCLWWSKEKMVIQAAEFSLVYVDKNCVWMCRHCCIGWAAFVHERMLNLCGRQWSIFWCFREDLMWILRLVGGLISCVILPEMG